MIEGIQIRQLPAKNSVSGQAFEWCTGISGKQLTFLVRHAGTVSGNHYHLGNDPSKNPERFVLLSGEGVFVACDGVHLLERPLTAFTEVLISPLIVHAFLAKTPVMFAEYRQTIYDPQHPDSHRADTFAEHLKRSGHPINPAALAAYAARVQEGQTG